MNETQSRKNPASFDQPNGGAAARLVSTINATGGVLAFPDGTHGPCGDPDWIDLADAYLAACAEVGAAPMVQKAGDV